MKEQNIPVRAGLWWSLLNMLENIILLLYYSFFSADSYLLSS